MSELQKYSLTVVCAGLHHLLFTSTARLQPYNLLLCLVSSKSAMVASASGICACSHVSVKNLMLHVLFGILLVLQVYPFYELESIFSPYFLLFVLLWPYSHHFTFRAPPEFEAYLHVSKLYQVVLSVNNAPGVHPVTWHPEVRLFN